MTNVIFLKIYITLILKGPLWVYNVKNTHLKKIIFLKEMMTFFIAYKGGGLMFKIQKKKKELRI